MVESGLAPRDTHVRLYEIPAVNKISGAPSMTGSSGGTNKEKQDITLSHNILICHILTGPKSAYAEKCAIVSIIVLNK